MDIGILENSLRRLTMELEIEHILEIYTLEEILERGDMTIQDALRILLESGELSLPEVKPL